VEKNEATGNEPPTCSRDGPFCVARKGVFFPPGVYGSFAYRYRRTGSFWSARGRLERAGGNAATCFTRQVSCVSKWQRRLPGGNQRLVPDLGLECIIFSCLSFILKKIENLNDWPTQRVFCNIQLVGHFSPFQFDSIVTGIHQSRPLSTATPSSTLQPAAPVKGQSTAKFAIFIHFFSSSRLPETVIEGRPV
jgi:hypothetical protein